MRLYRLILHLYDLAAGSLPRQHRTPEAMLWHQFLVWLRHRYGDYITLPTNIQQRAPLLEVFRIVTLGFSYFGILSCSTLTSKLATDGRALSRNTDCGFYDFGSNPDDVYQYNAEADSASLAERCLHTNSGADGCNYFVQQDLPYHEVNATCPFDDIHMCIGDGSFSVGYTTEPIDMRTLGLNSPIKIEILRDTICSPIINWSPWVAYDILSPNSTVNASLFTVYEYGSVKWVDGTEYTYFTNQPVNPLVLGDTYIL